MADERVHSLDAARAILLLLGIPFHVATKSLFDMPVPSPAFAQSTTIAIFMSLSHSFRMFAFFILSGFFSALIIAKRGRRTWLKDRVSRLGLPLVVSLLTIGPLQFYIHRDVLGRATNGIGPLPITVDHLWFLMVLILFVVSLYALRIETFARRPIVAKALTLTGWQGALLAAGLACWGIGRAIFDRYASGLPDLGITSSYLYHVPAFMIGALVYFSGIASTFFRGARPWQFYLAVVLTVLAISLDTIARPALKITGAKTLPEQFLSNGLELPLALLLSICLFTILEWVIRRDYAAIRFLVGGAMAIYLFHMIWTLLIVKALLAVDWPAEIQWVVGSFAVFALSALSYLAIRRSAWLSAAFSGTAIPSRAQAAATQN